LLNLRHPLIAPLIGFAFPIESDGVWELKFVRLYAPEGSLEDILSDLPAWWTPTTKAVAGIALAHGLGLLHGAVKASNILFDADRRMQRADFSPIRLETGEVEPFSGEGWTQKADISAFESLLFEIAVGYPSYLPIAATGVPPLLGEVPELITRIIEAG
jgi:serine/threonine protein kinase